MEAGKKTIPKWMDQLLTFVNVWLRRWLSETLQWNIVAQLDGHVLLVRLKRLVVGQLLLLLLDKELARQFPVQRATCCGVCVAIVTEQPAEHAPPLVLLLLLLLHRLMLVLLLGARLGTLLEDSWPHAAGRVAARLRVGGGAEGLESRVSG